MSKQVTMVTLDTSTTETGYAVWKNGVLCKANSIVVKQAEEDKSGKMIQAIFSLLNEQKPDIMVVEGLNVYNNPKTQEGQTDIIGACRGYAIEHDIWFDRLAPNDWRKLVADSGEKIPRKRDDCKKWDIERLGKLFAFKTDNDNLADAILIGKAYKTLFS